MCDRAFVAPSCSCLLSPDMALLPAPVLVLTNFKEVRIFQAILACPLRVSPVFTGDAVEGREKERTLWHWSVTEFGAGLKPAPTCITCATHPALKPRGSS